VDRDTPVSITPTVLFTNFANLKHLKLCKFLLQNKSNLFQNWKRENVCAKKIS
jgi:hypothetical protein